MGEVDYGTLKKGGFMRHVQKDRFSLRLRVMGGHLTADKLAKISEIASQYGHGYVHLTSDATVDSTTVVCPVTFVKTKVALEEREDGPVLEVRLNPGEPIQNVPQRLKDAGHQVLKVRQNEDGAYRLLVIKSRLG